MTTDETQANLDIHIAKMLHSEKGIYEKIFHDTVFTDILTAFIAAGTIVLFRSNEDIVTISLLVGIFCLVQAGTLKFEEWRLRR